MNGAGRIMVVVDSTLQPTVALEWALSHAIQSHHTIVLLFLDTSSFLKQGRESKKKAQEHLCSLKSLCHRRIPGVEVVVVWVKTAEGEEKGRVIVEEAKRQRATLLVLGKTEHRSIMSKFLRWVWVPMCRARRPHGTVDYCIQNSGCMAVGVRQRGDTLGKGGYLITTKTHNNFWLLA